MRMSGCRLESKEESSAEMPAAAAFEPRREWRMSGSHPAPFRRRLFLMSGGYFGLTAEGVKASDVVVILMGGQCPFVLKKQGVNSEPVGEAFVHGTCIL